MTTTSLVPTVVCNKSGTVRHEYVFSIYSMYLAYFRFVDDISSLRRVSLKRTFIFSIKTIVVFQQQYFSFTLFKGTFNMCAVESLQYSKALLLSYPY